MLLAGCPGKKRCEKRCEDAADTELAKSEVIQTGHICFFQLAVCFWVLGLPLFFAFRRWKVGSVPTVSTFSSLVLKEMNLLDSCCICCILGLELPDSYY